MRLSKWRKRGLIVAGMKLDDDALGGWTSYGISCLNSPQVNKIIRGPMAQKSLTQQRVEHAQGAS